MKNINLELIIKINELLSGKIKKKSQKIEYSCKTPPNTPIIYKNIYK
jgi:hypothetical protein